MAEIIGEQWSVSKGAGTKSSSGDGYRRILLGANSIEARRRSLSEIQSCQEITVTTT